MPRKILHLDLDAFFCAVEEQRDPSLRGKPFAVGGKPEERGVVASCSYAARQVGVRSAMPMSRALKLCPGLLIVSARHRAYGQTSDKVMAVLHDLTPLVEQISIDEAFLDVSDLPQSAEAIARELQRTIRDQLNLPASLGVATNKLVAKIATDVGKAAARTGDYPRAILAVPPGEEAAFLAPLPAIALWGVGPKTADQLARLGLKTIGDIAHWPEADLARRFGKYGHDLARHANGIDERTVESFHETKSISQETTFARDLADLIALKRTLRELSDQVGGRLRDSSLAGTTVKLKLRWPDFTTLSRQTTLAQPTDLDDEIYSAVLALFENEWRPGRAVRLLGVGVSGLGPPSRQLSLWDDRPEKNHKLLEAVDKLRDKYGDRVVKRGSEL
ncbi:MAG TPA: DNA polymerase IV [Anaerolineales bacterium]|nr:DNA polymerase IV [Anaerolineales bacterium]